MKGYARVCEVWRSWNVTTAEDLARRMQESYIQAIRDSNAIDSGYVELDSAREIATFGTVTRYTGSLLVLTELSNAAMCHKLLCKRFEERATLTLELVKEVHATLLAGCYDKRRYIELEERPGSFKKHDFIVGKDEVGVPPEEVEEELEELLDEMEDFQIGTPSAETILTAAAYFHAKFECIHPFADGNGRVGRLLVNYWLVLNNCPPITVFYEDREEYFDALQSYVDSESLDVLIAFLKKQTEKTWAAYAQ